MTAEQDIIQHMNESSTLPVASPPKYLLLIDSRVSNYQLIINAKQPGVYHIVFDVSEQATYSAILIKNIEEKIAELGVRAFTAIGLVQHNDGRPIYEMFGPTADYIKPKIHDIQNADPEIHTWNRISLFITMLRLKYGIQNFDMMACALYSNPDWKYVIDKLTSKTGVTIRASTDDTGAAALGGDWFLESHTGVNLKDVYFTGVIENYDGILVTEPPPPPPPPPSNISLILIDNTIPDIPTIINSLNDTTYCLVFNRDYDTYETILSKLRFLYGENRYILDDFYYATTGGTEEEHLASPAALQSETNWPFYEDSTTITIQKPVFFQRMKANQTHTQDAETNESASVNVSYIPRGKVRITDLDEIYEIAKTAGEVPSAADHEETLRFGCVGVLQHAPIITLGYKLTSMVPGPSAIIENVESMDANLSTWSSLGTFITALKTTYHITTLDFMACAMYANPDWKYIIDNLAVQTNITIRASHDNTGTLYEGGNWILETANINLTAVYFTELIYLWSYILPSSVSTLRFDGVDDAVNLGIPAWTYSTQFRSTATIECWFRTTDTNTQKALSTFVSQLIGGDSADMFSLHMKSNGRISFWIVNQNRTFYEFVTTQTYNDATWHHVAVTFNSANGDTRIYIDGSLTTVGTAASLVPLRYNSTITLIVGSDRAGVFHNQSDRQFRGSLSDIRMWNVVRTATEISTNYRQRLSGNETGLMGYWKMNQGYGSGWGTLTVVLDSTFNRVNGTLTNFASPSTSWVTSTLEFAPRISNFILGPKNGVYDMVDSSFSFIDPSSNSLGTFSYAINNGNATISNGAATTKVIYSNPGPVSIPTLNTYDFPMLADLTNWQIDMSFTVTGGSGTYRALIGEMYSDMTPANRGWGMYISNTNRIYWTWLVNDFTTANLNVNLNTPYLITAIQNSGVLTLRLTNITLGTTITETYSVGSNILGRGPVTLGGWRRRASDGYPNEDLPGTISYVNVSVPTVFRNVTFVSATSSATSITATQDSLIDYGIGTQSASLTLNRSAPSISTWTITDVSFGVAPFTLTAPSSNSNGAFVYSNSTNTGVATVTSGGVVTVVGAGSTTFTATQDACGNYTSRSVTGTLTVRPIAPSISTWTISEKRINDISFTLTAPSSNSSGAFTYSTDASGSAIASVTSSGIVTLTGVAGTAVITAIQDACGNYTGGSSVVGSLVVTAALSNFTVPSNKVYGNAAFDLTDPTTIYSGESFIFTSSNTYVASIGGAGGRTVTIHKAGSTIITAKQLATGAHPELTISAVLVVAKNTPVITLSSITKNYGDASFNLSPSSTNNDTLGSGQNGDGLGGGLFSYTSSNNSVISIFDTSNVSITGVGSALIVIEQSATMNFTSGTANVAVTINKGTPILSAFTVGTSRTYGSAPFSALAYPTSASNGAIVYSSSDSTVASIDSSGVITLLAAGYVNFTATQAATAYYNSTTKTSNTMTVHRQILQLTRSSPTASTINKTYGDGYFNVVATNASNGGTITYETDNPSVAGIVGGATAGVISVVSVGTATITARRGQTDQYESNPVSWTIEVARTTTTLSGLSDLSYNVTAAPFTVSASSASDGAVTYSLQDPSSNVLTIHPTSGLVTLRSAGSAVIVASQAQGTLYLAPASITSTITVNSAGNALQGATITSTASFAAVNLEGASLAGISITNTAFTSANLSNANLTNAVIVSANFTSADLSGATLAGATITGATFTSASLKNADLSGAILTSTVFTGSDLSGARLTGVDASGASFANAKLTNVDMTGANIANVNFTNTSIKGANIADVSFSPLQKLQLLKNSDNRDIGQIIIPAVTGATVLAAISETSPLRAIQNLDLTTATVSVVVPTTSTSPTDILPDVVLNVATSDKFYLPINESEYFQVEGVKYFATGGVVRNYLTNAVVEVISYNGTPVWLLAGSIVGLVLQTNTLNSSSFVVPSRMLLTATTPFMPTTLPISNHSETPIVYSSSNTNIATIDASSGQITITGNFVGFVTFMATQVQTSTYEPGVSMSNTLFVDRAINFSLSGLNQTFNLSTLATLDASSISMEATDATAVFYVRLSDINNIFMYQSDASDITNVTANDIKYYVFHRKWPTELKLNPSHAMMNKTESAGMLGVSEGFSDDKSLAKHDFIRYIALRLFNTIHGVDLFQNETELHENSVFLGETVQNNIETILSGISTTSASGTMSYDASGNKYLTNDASGNTNLCREIIRHIAAVAPSRFYGNIPNHAGLKNVPFMENDTLQYKLVIQAAATQNLLTGVSAIPSRSYTIKLVIKNTVDSNTNANTVITDDIMFPNSYPYSSSVRTYAPTVDSSGVYNIYSPPAPIPFARFGYNGWYYTNSTAWVNVAPAVRNHIKWLVSANTATSKVSDLQYIRVNLKIHNTTSLPYVMVYTQAGSSRKYAVVSGNGSLVNGTVYSFYMNFNTYAREPTTIGATNVALAYTIGTGSFAVGELITSIAIESNSAAAASNVEFTLSSVVVGELSGEKEYGFEAAVPETYP